MSSHTATFGEKTAAQWARAKPIAIGLAIGLIAGPMISGYAGWQVRASTAQAATRAGVVEQQAAFCAERARAASPAAASLDWQAKSDLARRWAAMPGSNAVDPTVVNECSRRLSS